MIPRNQETAYDSVNEMRNNRKSHREDGKKYSRLEMEWDDYDEREYGHDEREDY